MKYIKGVDFRKITALSISIGRQDRPGRFVTESAAGLIRKGRQKSVAMGGGIGA